MNILYKIINGVWCIHPAEGMNYLPLVTSILKGEQRPLNAQSEEQRPIRVFSQSNLAVRVYAPYQIKWLEEKTVIVVDVKGAITKYWSCEGIGGEEIVNILQAAQNSEKVKGVVLDIDSPGGDAEAMIAVTNKIQNFNKPIVAFVNGSCYSAAYGIASQCDAIIANNQFAGVGSIGTYTTLIDYTEYFKKQGVNIIDIYATASKDKNKEYRDIIAGNTKATVARIDALNNFFLDTVAMGRKDQLKEDKEVWGTGKTWTAPDAIDLGLVDKIDTLESAIDYIV